MLKKTELGAGGGVYFYLREKRPEKAAENNIMDNPVIFIPGMEMTKSMKLRYLVHWKAWESRQVRR